MSETSKDDLRHAQLKRLVEIEATEGPAAAARAMQPLIDQEMAQFREMVETLKHLLMLYPARYDQVKLATILLTLITPEGKEHAISWAEGIHWVRQLMREGAQE